MGFCHFDYMSSPEWMKVRKKVMERDHSECVVCGHFSTGNEVHHETYDNVGKPEEADDCVTVCREHHKGLENTKRYLKVNHDSKTTHKPRV